MQINIFKMASKMATGIFRCSTFVLIQLELWSWYQYICFQGQEFHLKWQKTDWSFLCEDIQDGHQNGHQNKKMAINFSLIELALQSWYQNICYDGHGTNLK